MGPMASNPIWLMGTSEGGTLFCSVGLVFTGPLFEGAREFVSNTDELDANSSWIDAESVGKGSGA